MRTLSTRSNPTRLRMSDIGLGLNS